MPRSRCWSATRSSPTRQLVAAVAEVVRRPRQDPASSFVLHAPLELAARTALLPRIAPAAREQARLRLVALATEYEGSDDPIAEPPARDAGSAADESKHLLDAIAAGDLDAVDVGAACLARSATAPQLRGLLADPLVPLLAAAAHAPIFLFELPRVAPRGELPVELLRPLARELARHPDWRLGWYEQSTAEGPPSSPDELFDAIAQTPQLGVPGSDFIFPVMAQAQASGTATDLAAHARPPRDTRAAGQAVLRAAALSMLTEDPRVRAVRMVALPDAPAGRARHRGRVPRPAGPARGGDDVRRRVPRRVRTAALAARPSPAANGLALGRGTRRRPGGGGGHGMARA